MDETDNNINHALIELNHSQFEEAPESYMQQLAKQWFEIVMLSDATNDVSIKTLTEGLNQFGQIEQQAFWDISNRLKNPLEKLMREAQGGDKVTRLLSELQIIVLKIKPPKPSLWGNFMNMFKLLFSLKESTWHIWIEDYPTHKQQILKITENLESHKRQLKRDNLLFFTDKNSLDSHMQMLESSFDMICYLEKTSSHETAHNNKLRTDTKQLLVDELLPAMHLRLVELQQQLLIARQSVLTMDLFIRQNESQIRGIDQALYTTTSVIEVTASIYALKQAEKSGQSLKIDKQSNNSIADKQRLKQARHLIDQAMSDVANVKSGSKNILNSTDSSKE
jgi:uncharacterized protein YaaN involved in tellurite resistance